MADNTTLNASAGGDTVRDLDRTFAQTGGTTAGPKVQVMALDAAGSALAPERLVSSQAPLPVLDPSTQIILQLQAQQVLATQASANGSFIPFDVPWFLSGG